MNEEGPIRTKNSDGSLAHAGFVWSQPIKARGKIFVIAVVTCAATAALTSALIILYIKQTAWPKFDTAHLFVLTPFALGWVLLLALLVFGFLFRPIGREKAGVSFSSLGEIWVTRRRKLFDKYDSLRAMCLKYGTDEIASIELASMKTIRGGHYIHGDSTHRYPAYDIWLHFASGERFYVAEFLTESEGLVIVEQLKLARREMRLATSAA